MQIDDMSEYNRDLMAQLIRPPKQESVRGLWAWQEFRKRMRAGIRHRGNAECRGCQRPKGRTDGSQRTPAPQPLK
jgi:hypothetical protein